MKTTFKVLFGCLLVLGLIPALAHGQVTLLSPPDGAHLSDPPAFSWSGAFDAWFFISVFYYDIPGVYTGYYTVFFWLLANGFDMPGSWWDPIGVDTPNFWILMGVNTATGATEFSSLWSFTKAGECTGQCCGTYEFGCGGSSICVCYTTVEGDTACGPDFSCAALATCVSSADCGVGERCLACTCCANPNVCVPVDEALCAEGFSSFDSYEEGLTTTGQWISK